MRFKLSKFVEFARTMYMDGKEEVDNIMHNSWKNLRKHLANIMHNSWKNLRKHLANIMHNLRNKLRKHHGRIWLPILPIRLPFCFAYKYVLNFIVKHQEPWINVFTFCEIVYNSHCSPKTRLTYQVTLVASTHSSYPNLSLCIQSVAFKLYRGSYHLW